MKKSVVRRVATVVFAAVMMVTSVVPGKAFAQETGEDDAAASQLVSAASEEEDAELQAEEIQYENTEASYGLRKADTSKYSEYLYGGDKTEYYLGVASHFVLFGKKIVMEGVADCEGRIAADEFSVNTCPNGGYPVVGALTSGKAKGQAADIICNNSISKTFGNVNATLGGGVSKHTFIVSDAVTTIVAPSNQSYIASDLRQNTYTVPVNALINFDKEMEKLAQKSIALTRMTAGKVTNSYGSVSMKGSDSKLNVFNIDEATWKAANSIAISVPKGSFVVINVAGKNVAFNNGQTFALSVNGATVSQGSDLNAYVLFNLYEATSVTLNCPNRGAILAPKAFVKDACCYQHLAAQIIAREIYVKNEIGTYGFLLPPPEEEPESEAYTVHYMYYNENGEICEIPASLYSLFISKSAAPMPNNNIKGYNPADKITAVTSSNKNSVIDTLSKNSALSVYASLIKNGCDVRFEVYEDGNDWNKALSGSSLTKASSYDSMTKKADIVWDETYTFGKSNVYFIMYPTAKVTVDVSWDDKHDKGQKRPGQFTVDLVENIYNPSEGQAEAVKKDSSSLLKKTATQKIVVDSELNKEIVYDVYTDTYTFLVPLFGRQADVNGDATSRTYGSDISKFGENGIFNISYTVPDDYYDVTVTKVEKPAGAKVVDANGVVANYHIVLRGEYKAKFYLVDAKGLRTEIRRENFFNEDSEEYEMFRGLATTAELPVLNGTDLKTILGRTATRRSSEYTVMWRDIETGKSYVAGEQNYTFDYEDVVFETTVRRTELLDEIPWLYSNIINYRNSHYIPGSVVTSVMDMKDPNGLDEDAFKFDIIQGYNTSYSYDTLRNGRYKDAEFFLFSFAYGIDIDRAAATRVTVSTEGYGSDCEIFYEAEERAATKEDGGLKDTFMSLTSWKKGKTIAQLIPEDPYVNDYDGMRYFRLVLPKEFENKTLYFTVYYIDANGQESVWLYYHMDFAKNKFWSLHR